MRIYCPECYYAGDGDVVNVRGATRVVCPICDAGRHDDVMLITSPRDLSEFAAMLRGDAAVAELAAELWADDAAALLTPQKRRKT